MLLQHVHIVETGNKIDYLWAKPPAELGLRCPCKPPCMCNWTLATGGEFESATEGVFGTHGVEYGVFCEVDANETQWLQEAAWAVFQCTIEYFLQAAISFTLNLMLGNLAG